MPMAEQKQQSQSTDSDMGTDDTSMGSNDRGTNQNAGSFSQDSDRAGRMNQQGDRR